MELALTPPPGGKNPYSRKVGMNWLWPIFQSAPPWNDSIQLVRTLVSKLVTEELTPVAVKAAKPAEIQYRCGSFDRL